MTKVLIAISANSRHKYCLDEFAESLKNQKSDILFVVPKDQDAYAKLIRSKGFEVVENSDDKKYLRDHALKNDYDYVLFVGDTILIPPNTAESLIETEGDVISGVYLNVFEIGGKKEIAPALFKDIGNGECKLFKYDHVAMPQIMEIGAASFGCTLVPKKVLEVVEFRTGKMDPGIAFYLDAREKGFKAMANTTVRCLHRPFPGDDPRAIHFAWTRRVEPNYYLKKK